MSIIRNRTAIEEEEVRAAERKGLPSSSYPFDIGVGGNVRQFLGTRWWTWPLSLSPQQAGLGDGLTYPRRNQQPWPPVEERREEQPPMKQYWDPAEGAYVVPGGLLAQQMRRHPSHTQIND